MRNIYFLIFYLFSYLLFSQIKIEGIVLGEQKNGKISIFSKESDEKIGISTIAIKNIIVQDGIFNIEIDNLSEIPILVKAVGSENLQFVSKDFYIDKDVKKIIFIEKEGDREIDVYVSPLNKNQIDNLEKQVFFRDNTKGWEDWENSLRETIFKKEEINRKIVDSLRNILIKNDSDKIKNYIETHPRSYIALLDLYRSNYTVTKFDSLYNNFDSKIKESDLGKLFQLNRENLIFRQKTDFFKAGEFQFKDINLKEEIFNVSSLTSARYYLIDFWFSYCGPCIAEIPKYKELHSEYKNKGFEIVSISSDRTKDISNWLALIDKHDIPWKQFLDENGIVTKDIGVHKFPTNFLIDNNGKIIQKDIPQYDLENFLKENLN